MRKITGVAIGAFPALSVRLAQTNLLRSMTSSLNGLFSYHLGDDLQLIFISPRKYLMPPRTGALCAHESGTERIASAVSGHRALPKKEATMKTRDTQGSFITVLWALIGKVKEVAETGVPIRRRADLVADLLLLPVVARSTQRRLAEEARLSNRVSRYSSSHSCEASCASSNSIARCWGTHSSAPERRAK